MGHGKFAVTAAAYILIVSCFLAAICGASQATSTLVQMIPVERENTVIIDPGHGGVDGGATSCTGVLESKFNLDISLRLRDLFHLLGFRTQMIRTEDISVYTAGDNIAAKKVSDLRQRVRMVNETEDAVLISIHQNTFPDSRYSGAQVFYGTVGDSKQLADSMQHAFVNTLNPGSNRSCKRAEGVYLLQHIEKTGVLVECGFLSNPQEEAKLRSAEYQKKICCVVAASTAQFLTK